MSSELIILNQRLAVPHVLLIGELRSKLLDISNLQTPTESPEIVTQAFLVPHGRGREHMILGDQPVDGHLGSRLNADYLAVIN